MDSASAAASPRIVVPPDSRSSPSADRANRENRVVSGLSSAAVISSGNTTAIAVR